MELGRYSAAQDCLRKALLYNPQEGLILCRRAWCYFFQGQLAEAKALGKQVLLLTSNLSYATSRWHAHLVLGCVAQAKSQKEQAQQHFTTALQGADPQRLVWLYTEQGKGLEHLQDYPAALESYEQAIRLHTEAMGASLGKARVLLATKQYQSAQQWLDQLFERKPQHPELLKLKKALATRWSMALSKSINLSCSSKALVQGEASRSLCS